MKRRILTLAILCSVGLVIGTLGTWSLPLGHGYSAFWPALIVQIAGGIWFGGWGVIAAAIFPIFTNALAHVGSSGVLGFIPANLAQGLIPAWAFRHFKMDPAIPGRKGLQFYLLWGALMPAAAGASLGALAVVLFGEAGWSSYPLLVLKWSLPHVLVSLLIGIPTLRVLTPLWRDMGCLVSGAWGINTAGEEDCSGIWRFRDMPIQLKLVLALCGLGLSPLLVISFVQLARGSNSGNESVTPLFLTLGLVLSILGVGWLSREVIRPLRELQEKVESLMQGRQVALACSRQDEVGQLARAFERLLEDRRRAQTEALRGQKLQQLGMLAGGIAHDFNNLLQSINCQVYLMRSELADSHPWSSKLDGIESAVARASRFASELLRLNREQPIQVGVVDLNVLAREAVRTATPLLGGQVHCDLKLSPEFLPVLANGTQLEQVILNLIVNARDAMPKGGLLGVETGKDATAQNIFVRVTDSGTGIADHVKEHIFEPFFTTKSPGRGTGLGLAIVSDVVRKSKGSIEVNSQAGIGSTFTVRLPLHQPSQTDGGNSGRQQQLSQSETLA